MTNRDLIYRALNHQETDIVPIEVEFLDLTAFRMFMPNYPEISDWRQASAERMSFLGNAIIDVTPHHLHESKWVQEAHNLMRVQSSPSNVGAGYLRTKEIENTDDFVVIEFETGSRWKLHKNPFIREYISYPVKEESDLEKISLVDVNDPQRYKGVEESVTFFKKKGYFTSAEIYGFFSGVWYRYYYVVDFLIGLLDNKSFIKKMVDLLGAMNLQAAENYLKLGVDSIFFADDLGDRNGPLISPDTYREFFFPWHRRLAALCHSYGAICHMHSHGNINKFLPLLVDAGIDILNPLDPEDSMYLAELKQKYGKEMTFLATTRRSILGMDRKSLDELIRERITTGKKGGGFILHLGGITSHLDRETVYLYIELSKKLCGID